MLYKILFLLCGFTALFADIRDYLRPVVDKPLQTGMANIDFIYLINLDERPEKLQGCLDILAPYGIHVCRFSAINGWNLFDFVQNLANVAIVPIR